MSAVPPQFDPRKGQLILKFPCNKTAVVVFVSLAILHAAGSVALFHVGPYLFAVCTSLAGVFIVLAWIFRADGREVEISPDDGLIYSGRRLGRRWRGRIVKFDQVQGVKMTRVSRPGEWFVEILCRDGNIECPPSLDPGQQALCLAMLMHVPLIKVFDTQPVVQDGNMDPGVTVSD